MAQGTTNPIDFTEVTRIQDRAVAEAGLLIKAGGAVLIEAPTGAGKTRINSRNIELLAKEFEALHGRKPRILALQHRETLLEQAEKALERWSPESGLTVGRSIEGNVDQTGDVNFATVQTIAANLAMLDRIDILTIDETHHASDNGGAEYSKVIDHVFAQNPQAMLIGTTATPARPDARGLHPRLAAAPRVSISYGELVRAGQIKMPKTREVDILLADGTTTRSIMRSKYKPDKEADPAGLNKALRKLRPADYNHQMLSAWERQFKDPLDAQGVSAGTIVYESTIASARKFAADAAERGHKVAYMDSDQSKEDNDAALAGLRNGTVDMVVSVKMIDEGVDVPNVRGIIINRETTSEIEYNQMVGRSVRMGDDPILQGISPSVFDGGSSTMIHGAVERRAVVADYMKELERGELIAVRNEDAKYMPQFGGESYTPWRVMKEPPPVMAITDGKSNIYAVATKGPDGQPLYSMSEMQMVKGKAQVTLMRDADKKPLVGISEARLHQIEAERLLPSRHSILRLESTESLKHSGKSLIDERLLATPEHVRSAELFAAQMAKFAPGR